MDSLSQAAQRVCVCSSSQVSGAGLRWTGSCDGEVRLPPQRVRLPPGGEEAEGQLRQRLAVCLEIWQDGRHELPDPRLRRLGTRQRELPDPSEVGVALCHSVSTFLLLLLF